MNSGYWNKSRSGVFIEPTVSGEVLRRRGPGTLWEAAAKGDRDAIAVLRDVALQEGVVDDWIEAIAQQYAHPPLSPLFPVDARVAPQEVRLTETIWRALSVLCKNRITRSGLVAVLITREWARVNPGEPLPELPED